MRNKTYGSLKKDLFVVLFILGILNGYIYAQPPRPQMWVSKQNSILRREWFNFGTLNPGTFSKERILSDIMGVPHPLSISFSTDAFEDLLDKMEAEYGSKFEGLNVYITAFDTRCPGPLKSPGTLNKQIVLIFAPAREFQKKPFISEDLGKYFILNPDDSKCHEVDISIKTCWVNNYIANEVSVAGGLATTLELNAQENKMSDGSQSDTRCIYYSYSDFKEFIRVERKYQDNNTITNPGKLIINEIEIDFASYPDSGIGANDYEYPLTNFKNRLIILFEFKREGKIFYIDDTTDFPRRHPRGKRKGGDNGQLCPPNCPR